MKYVLKFIIIQFEKGSIKQSKIIFLREFTIWIKYTIDKNEGMLMGTMNSHKRALRGEKIPTTITINKA
jgi:hypothetical protein